MRGGFVYLLTEDGDNQLYKIGVTRSTIEARLKKLQTGNGNHLRCVHSFYSDKPYKLEKMLHFRFSESREEGEWFLMTKEDVDSFPSLCEQYQNTIDALKDNPFF